MPNTDVEDAWFRVVCELWYEMHRVGTLVTKTKRRFALPLPPMSVHTVDALSMSRLLTVPVVYMQHVHTIHDAH